MDDLSRRRPFKVARPWRPWLSRACPCHDGTEPPIVGDIGKEFLRQRGRLSRGGRSMGVTNPAGLRWASSGVKPRELGRERAGSAGRSPHWSLWGEIWTVERRGNSGAREHALPAQGLGRSGEPAGPDSGSEGYRPDSSKPRSRRVAEAPGPCTQGWLQPACACAGKIAFTAARTSDATPDEPIQRQRRTRVIALVHPYVPGNCEEKIYGQTGRD